MLPTLEHAYLGNKHQTERDGCAENDEKRDDEIGVVRPILDDERYRDAGHTHDHNVVHTHTDVLGVVQRRYTHVARLPSQETTNQLQGNST